MVTGIRLVVGDENSAYNILIEFQAKRQIDLLCNAGTAVLPRIILVDEGSNGQLSDIIEKLIIRYPQDWATF